VGRIFLPNEKLSQPRPGRLPQGDSRRGAAGAGKGCGPGILGVCVGGDRATGYEFSKQQFLRRLDDTNPNPELNKLEQDIVETSNKLGIGPMGFGGKTTLLGTKIGVLNRLPASYFVSISYMCWAYRRQGVTLDANGQIQKWLY
jgi:fumarate hydratase class I